MGIYVEDPTGGAGPSTPKYKNSFVATSGQTVFNLTSNVASVIQLFIGGILNTTIVITLSGAKQITLNTAISLGETVDVYYN